MAEAAQKGQDWNPGSYLKFQGHRLRPALDLLGAVTDLPAGDVIDLGCGAGTVGPALAGRFPMRRLIGVDSSPAMLSKAAAISTYTDLVEADAAEWRPDRRPALVFSNAVLHWLPDHGGLMPQLVGTLTAGGTLAVQMPRQFGEPSHRLMREVAASLFPSRFEIGSWLPPVSRPEDYAMLLSPLGDVSVWETVYHQNLEPVSEGHPVRAFTQSTAARPILEKLSSEEASTFLEAYDDALAHAYPVGGDGRVLFPFRRLFFTVTRREPSST